MESVLLKSANIFLAFVMLACPYICVGAHPVRGLCPHIDCHDECQSTVDETSQDADAACGDCVHAVQTAPAERPTEEPRRSSQCLCQGAVVQAELRLPAIDLAYAMESVADHLVDTAGESVPTGCIEFADVSPRRTGGRSICVRVCALLI
jgi:hypothetical protein